MSESLTRRRFVKQTAIAVGASVAGWPWDEADAADNGFLPRFCICNETFQNWPFEKAVAFAAECGYQGMEIAPFTISNYVTEVTAKERQRMRRVAETAGLQIVGLHWLLARTNGFHLTGPDRSVRKQTVEYLAALARFCADLGGELLVFGSPQQRNLTSGVTKQQGIEYASEVIGQLLPTLESTGVRLALEPLSPRATNFMRTAAEAVEVIQHVDSPRCQLILDCNAMAVESQPPADLIRKYRSQLIHFHANDPNGQGPGFGQLDFVPIFSALREIGYSGWISVEVFNYDPGPERLARESIEYMKKCLRSTSANRP